MSGFEAEYFPSQKTDAGVAVVIYGLDPIRGQLARTVDALAEENDVFTYSYGSEVARGGDPSALPALIDAIQVDVQDKISDTDPARVRIVGASLGALVGYNLQQRLDLQLPGLYTSAGVNAASNVMRNPIFRSARKAFTANKVGIHELNRAWEDIDMDPNKPGAVPAIFAISRLDPVVPYPYANRNLKAWQQAGARIRVLPSWIVRHEGTSFHTAAINHFDKNIAEILTISKTI
jgi:predicted alpha/beta hydrolase family esterase